MRPIGRLFCCLAAFAASIAGAQNNPTNYPAPTIHNSGQHSTAVPLPPLGSNGQPNASHPSDASWVGSPANVVPATFTSPINTASTNAAPTNAARANSVQPNSVQPASAQSPSQPAARRTPLNPPKSASTVEENSRTEGNTLRMLFSVGSSLLIVIGLFLGVAWCYRKTLNTSMGGIPKHVVSVLGRTAVAPRQQLVLVRFGSKLVLVSMVQGEARTISEISDPLEVDQLAGACESHQPHSLTNSFRSILNQNGGGAV